MVYEEIRPEDIVDTKTLIIPDGTTEIKVRVHEWEKANDKEIWKVVIPSTVQTIGDFVFYGCVSLKKVIGLHDNIICIGSWCFSGCKNLFSIYWPENTGVIPTGAFANSSIRHLHLRKELRTIREKAFENCIVENLHIEDFERYCTKVFLKGSTSSPFSNETKLYLDDTAISDTLILSTKEHIANYAFYGMKGISQIFLPNAELVGKSSFEKSDIESVVFGSNMKELYTNAFAYCDKLQKLVFYAPEIIISSTSFSGVNNAVTLKLVSQTSEEEYAFPEINDELLYSVLNLPDDYLPF